MPSVLQLQHLKPQWLVTIPWVHLSSPRVSPGILTQCSCVKINSQVCFQKHLTSVLWPCGHPNILWRSCHFSDHHPCHTILLIASHTLCYSFSFYLLLHLATSADSGTVTTLSLLNATRSQLVQPFQNQLAEIWGFLVFFHPLCCALCIFLIHQEFVRVNLATAGHNGHNAAATSLFGLCSGNEDRSQFLLFAPNMQDVTVDHSLLPALIWWGKHI